MKNGEMYVDVAEADGDVVGVFDTVRVLDGVRV